MCKKYNMSEFHVNHRKPTTWTDAKGFFLIILCVCAIYFPTLSFEFTNWDDPSFVLDNNALQVSGWSGIIGVLTQSIPADFGDYLPVTNFSYWVDYQLWQFQPMGYHLTNILLHAAISGVNVAPIHPQERCQ